MEGQAGDRAKSISAFSNLVGCISELNSKISQLEHVNVKQNGRTVILEGGGLSIETGALSKEIPGYFWSWRQVLTYQQAELDSHYSIHNCVKVSQDLT